MLESKRKAIIFIVISVLLAATAGFLVLKKVQALNTNLGTSVKIFVANDTIPSRSLITPNDVKTEEIPKKYLKKGYHITDVNDLVNQVSVVPLAKGDIITHNVLKTASDVVDENNRLITLAQNERVFFDEQLFALDRVDLIVSDRFSGKEETKIFMRDVKVARVSNNSKMIQLEVPLDKVPDLIQMQNYADSLRVIKANVGKSEGADSSKAAEDQEEKTQTEQKTETKPETKPASQPKEQKPTQQQPAKDTSKQPAKTTTKKP